MTTISNAVSKLRRRLKASASRNCLGLGAPHFFFSWFTNNVPRGVLRKDTRRLIKYHPEGVKFPLWIRRNTSDYLIFFQIFFKGDYDIPIPLPPDSAASGEITIVDCGANIGLASSFFKRRFPKARIIAVEPEGENFALLQKNLGGHPDITCVNKGIWSRECHLRITNPEGANCTFFVEETDGPPGIPAISIDALIAEHQLETIDVLKIDIEGSEKEIFTHGAEKWLPRVRVLIIELHDRYKRGCSKAVFSVMSKYDFSSEISGDCIVFYRDV